MCAQAPPSALESARESASWQVAERGPHHRTWQKILTTTDARGRVVSQTNLAYIELATGMHYLENGQWREAQEVIESFPDGAIARHGAHRVIFANNLNVAGAVDLQMPDGRRVRSHLLGLAWWDAGSGKGVLVGGVKECSGKLLPPNQVLYADAFEGLKADVRYTWTRAGLEQDVILREWPPGPDRFGLDPKTARLQVWTEFVESPEARLEEVAVLTKDGREARDVWVDWGSMAIGPGRAFAVGEAAGEENKLADAEGTGSVRVSKEWMKIEGRQFLVEEVEWGAVRAAVERLPTAQAARAAEERVGPVAMWLPAAPPQRIAKREATPMQVAEAAHLGQGFVVDYVVLNTTQNNYTFRGDMTYFITNQVNLNGTTTFEGGAVIKFRRSNSGLRLNGPWVCRTGPYRPVIFTAQDDNTVGETIAGSTGTPTGYYGNGVTLTKAGSFAEARFRYLTWAVRYEPRNDPELRLAHLQWVRCQAALSVVDDVCLCGTTIYVDNALVAQCPSFLTLLEGEEALVHARHLTVDQCGRLAECETGQLSLAMTNSILSSVTVVSSGGASVTGSHNAFYNTQPFGEEPRIGLESSPFQSVGAGHYYLGTAGQNALRNKGTPNLPGALLDALAEKTVSPPVVHQNVQWNQDLTLTTRCLGDNDGQPDLGYHYDVLDYLVWNVTVSGATLRLARCCAVAVYGTPGFDLLSGARWESTGTPLKLNRLVRYQAVQEQPVILGNNPGNMMTLLRVPGSPPPLPQMEFRFTEVALLADSARRRTLFDNGGIHQADRLTFTDCRLYGVNLSVGTYRLLGDHRLMSFALINSLTERCDIAASEESEDPELPSLVVHLRNNLFRNGTLGLADYLETGAWSAQDNLFDTVALVGLGVANSHNGYISTAVLPGSGGGDKTIAPPADYQEGPLGPYYYPTSGTKLAQLIDAGSRSAAAAGLYHHTVLTNRQAGAQIKETNSVVDIGYHYGAVDENGQPLDSDGDGLADYLEDANGNGAYDAGDLANWTAADTDWDGLPDAYEYLVAHTSSTMPDSDDDGLSDGLEFQLGFNPLNAYSQDSSHTFKDGQWYLTAKTGQTGTRAELIWDYAEYDPWDDITYLWFSVSGVTESDLHRIYIQTPSIDSTDMNLVWQDMFFNFGWDDLGYDANTATRRYATAWWGEITDAVFAALDGQDRDFDGLQDGYEILATQTAAGVPSSDGSGTPDGDAEPSGDGISNLRKWQYGLNPWSPASAQDTDGDGIPDWFRVYIAIWFGAGATGAWVDADDDSVPNIVEFDIGSDPTIRDYGGYFPPPPDPAAEFVTVHLSAVPYSASQGPSGNPYFPTVALSTGPLGITAGMVVTPTHFEGAGVADVDLYIMPIQSFYYNVWPFTEDGTPAQGEVQRPDPDDLFGYRDMMDLATDFADNLWGEIEEPVLEALRHRTYEYASATAKMRVAYACRQIQWLEYHRSNVGDQPGLRMRIQKQTSIVHTEITKMTAINAKYIAKYPADGLRYVGKVIKGVQWLSFAMNLPGEMEDFRERILDYLSDVWNQRDWGASALLSMKIQECLNSIPGMPPG